MTQDIQQLREEIRRERVAAEKQLKLDRYRRLNRFARKGQIVFAGSSLMEQFPVNEFLMQAPLPCCIYNRGVGGFTTTELLNALDVCILDLEPAHLFLNIGTNDLNGPQYDQTAMLARYAQILQTVQAKLPCTKLYLLAYYPVCPAAADTPRMQEILRHRTNRRIAAASQGVQALAEKYGASFLDLNAGLTDAAGSLKPEFTVEGIHMYANGYQVVWQNLRPVLQQISHIPPAQA